MCLAVLVKGVQTSAYTTTTCLLSHITSQLTLHKFLLIQGAHTRDKPPLLASTFPQYMSGSIAHNSLLVQLERILRQLSTRYVN